MLGIGGGILQVPALNAWCGVPMRAAAATTAAMIGITALGSAPIYYARGHVVAPLAAAAVLGVLAGFPARHVVLSSGAREGAEVDHGNRAGGGGDHLLLSEHRRMNAERDVEDRLLWFVRGAVLASGAALACGLLLHVARGEETASRSLLALGLMLLMSIPAARVLIAAADRVRKRDWYFVVATLVVLVELCVALWFASRRL